MGQLGVEIDRDGTVRYGDRETEMGQLGMETERQRWDS